MRQIIYRWPRFTLSYDLQNDAVTTYYDQWRYSRVLPDADDQELGDELGLPPQEHKLAHELAHHLVAVHCGLDTSPIVWHSAHFYEHPQPESDDEEAVVKALVYYALSDEAYARDEARIDPRRLDGLRAVGVDVDAVAAELRHLVEAARPDRTSGVAVELG